MSVLLEKRQSLGLVDSVLEEIDSKRFKSNESISDREIVYFLCSSFEENLSRLCLLFPTMENQELYQCLELTNNNLEEAIKQLEELSLEKQDLSRQYAKALVSSFENATKEEAIEIATNAFNQFYQEMPKKESI